MSAERRAWPLGAFLAVTLVLLLAGAVSLGRTGSFDLQTSFQGILALGGLAAPLDPPRNQAIVDLRFWRGVCAAGVGAALALAGSLLQGIFRNGLAAPSVIGTSAGAGLGAALAILALGGYGPAAFSGQGGAAATVVAGSAFAGAMLATGLVVLLATEQGRVSVPTLLLAGIAVNTCFAGLLIGIQAFTLQDFEVARALLSWSFGSLDDKSPVHALLVWGAVGVVALMLPLVTRELDLLAAGEDDARALGVRTGLVKALVVAAAALTAATAVAVAGQIAFMGLVVPHIVRLAVGTSHRRVLPLSILLGAVFLLGTELLQMALLGGAALRPGVVMSLIGGPFFMVLLVLRRRELRAW